MKRWVPTISLVAVLFAGVTVSSVWGDDDDDGGSPKLSVTVAFGAGLNTGGPANHHVLPGIIHVKEGGVVNFVVAGFHQIFVYQPGKRPKDIAVPPSGTFINDLDGLFFQGLSPAGPPPTGFSNTQNRVESVSLPEKGMYLVICNVRTHFLNGMFAFVKVDD